MGHKLEKINHVLELPERCREEEGAEDGGVKDGVNTALGDAALGSNPERSWHEGLSQIPAAFFQEFFPFFSPCCAWGGCGFNASVV